jgi:hypothetical protein
MNLAFKIPKGLKTKTVLITFCLLLLVIIGVTLSYLYSKARNSLGDDAAVIVLAMLIAGELFLVVVGVKVAKSLDRLLSNHPPKPDSLIARFLESLGYEQKTEISEDPDLELFKSDEALFDDVEALLVLIEEKKRRGKKSKHAPEVRFRAVRDWMLLQARGGSMTLQEFLEERFGVAPESGMPLVHNQTFDMVQK